MTARNQVPPPGSVCWTSLTHPSSDEVVERTAMHRKMAADHRAASAMLREAESRACVGIPEADRDESPFQHREVLPGMTAEWLQRVTECTWRATPRWATRCPNEGLPLMLEGVTATVSSTGDGFAVAVRSDDVETANEIRRRAEALVRR